jgi:hypothetical protein
MSCLGSDTISAYRSEKADQANEKRSKLRAGEELAGELPGERRDQRLPVRESRPGE